MSLLWNGSSRFPSYPVQMISDISGNFLSFSLLHFRWYLLMSAWKNCFLTTLVTLNCLILRTARVENTEPLASFCRLKFTANPISCLFFQYEFDYAFSKNLKQYTYFLNYLLILLTCENKKQRSRNVQDIYLQTESESASVIAYDTMSVFKDDCRKQIEYELTV